MKRFVIFSLAAFFLLIANSASAQAKPAKNVETKSKVKTQNVKMKVKGNLSAVSLPYDVDYSSQFITGDPALCKVILDLWKDFDNNTLDRNPNAFADTVAVQMADGTWLRGQKEVLDAFKTYRSSLASVERTVDVVMSVRSIDRDEDWVLVWGKENETAKDGNKKTGGLHEAWRLNKDGKADLMLRFNQAVAKM